MNEGRDGGSIDWKQAAGTISILDVDLGMLEELLPKTRAVLRASLAIASPG